MAIVSSPLFRPLVFPPKRLRRLDIGRLPPFRATAAQYHQLPTVFAEIHPVAGAEIQAQLEDAGASAFDC
ncbi:MAG: hypothetical protein P4K98_01070 [Bryobacteraceae bacterium]|nr:hypothetical protein [Bryobacteraceae bacterium]